MPQDVAETESFPSFEPDNVLEEAMLAALGDPGRMNAFLDHLSAGALLLPVAGGEATEAGGRVLLKRIEYEGRRGVPAFTSLTQLRRAGYRGGRCVRMTGAALAPLWDDSALLLNPGGELGIALDASTVRSLGEARPKKTPEARA